MIILNPLEPGRAIALTEATDIAITRVVDYGRPLSDDVRRAPADSEMIIDQ